MSRLHFFSKSADNPPGKGMNEILSQADESANTFANLGEIYHWRKVLSNFHEGDFLYNGLHYHTAEHAFQARKICLVDAEKGFLFAIESNSRLSRGNGEEARKERKMVELDSRQILTWNNMSDNVMREIWLAKFTQVESAKRILLLTGTAELWHGSRGIPPTRWIKLEDIRADLRNV